MDRKLVLLSLVSLLLVAATLLAFAQVATAETGVATASDMMPAAGPSFDRDCSVCHVDHISVHPGGCEDCHVVVSVSPGNRHPEFRAMSDGVCVTCHQKGSLP